MPTTRIGDHTLFYEFQGQGAPVALLHHATASSRNWRRQLAHLANSFQVLAYDRPGFGRSEGLADWPMDYLDRDVEDLVALLDCVFGEPAALVGHSDGATIALLAAARYPDRVRCVVAEAPHVSVDPGATPGAIEAFLAEVDGSPALQEALARDHGAHAEGVLQRWSRRWLDPQFRSWDVSGELAAIACPVLVIHGLADPYFQVSHAEFIAAQLPQAELWLLPGVGHVPHIEASEAFNRRTLGFLLGCAGSMPAPSEDASLPGGSA